jgi:hypothetical protein
MLTRYRSYSAQIDAGPRNVEDETRRKIRSNDGADRSVDPNQPGTDAGAEGTSVGAGSGLTLGRPHARVREAAHSAHPA